MAAQAPDESGPSTGTDRSEASALLRIYRLIDATQVDTPFSGPGSDRGGRWTSEGTPGVYASLSASTALLEFLVHLDGEPPEPLFLASAWLPRTALFVPRDLPPDWDRRPYRTAVRAIGDDWSLSRRSLALQVPSAVCPADGNVIVNPEHPDFPRLVVAERAPIGVDGRLRPSRRG
jgi:RES domain-containing protein